MLMKWMLAALMLASGGVSAAELKDADSAVRLSDQFMQKIVAGQTREGYALLQPYVAFSQSELATLIDQTELQAPMLTSRFGKVTGYELLRNDTVGESLVQAVYLQRFEKHALVWRFVFYHGAQGWTINSFKYVDDLTTIL